MGPSKITVLSETSPFRISSVRLSIVCLSVPVSILLGQEAVDEGERFRNVGIEALALGIGPGEEVEGVGGVIVVVHA